MDFIQLSFNLFFVFVGAYLSVVLARILKQNGRVLKKMDEGFRMMGEKMDEGFRKMDEGFRKIDQGHRILAQLIIEHDEQKKRKLLEELRPVEKRG